jgi:hypothetical protein
MSWGVIQSFVTRYSLCFTESSKNSQRPLKENIVICNGGVFVPNIVIVRYCYLPRHIVPYFKWLYYCRLSLIQGACDLFQ